MNTQKHPSMDQLQKSSRLFLQLGLVLALFLVYGALELETAEKPTERSQKAVLNPEPLLVSDVFFTIERKHKITPKPQQKTREIIPVLPEALPHFEDLLPNNDSDKTPDITNQIDQITEAPTTTDHLEDVPFPIIENAPIFPGCEGLEKAASKKCFTEQLTKFVNRKFNTSLAEVLNLQGKQKIWVQFKIDKTGTVVDIQARAPHKNLEKEAVRVIKKLPLMTPAMQRKRTVGVKYTLPIIFEVQ